MNPYIKALPLIFAGVLLNAFAQIAIKKALHAVGGLEWTLPSLVRVGFNPWMIGCLTCYGLSVILWTGALNLVEVNYAYPFLALGFLANALLSKALLGETIPTLRWGALALIIAGVALQAFTGVAKQS